MRVLERREELIRIMVAERKSTISKLAVVLHVSDSTIRRDITILTSVYPLDMVRGKHGGVFLAKDYHPYKHVLTEEQTTVLEEILEITSNEHHRKALCQMLAELTSKDCRQKYSKKE